MYIILAVALIVIAAYYPIKLIKFYCMECEKQGLEAKITKGLKELQAPIAVNDYVVFNFEGVETLGMITNRNACKSEFTVRMLSGVKRGFFYLCDGTELTAISSESAIKELARQKEEWKNKKQKLY